MLRLESHLQKSGKSNSKHVWLLFLSTSLFKGFLLCIKGISHKNKQLQCTTNHSNQPQLTTRLLNITSSHLVLIIVFVGTHGALVITNRPHLWLLLGHLDEASTQNYQGDDAIADICFNHSAKQVAHFGSTFTADQWSGNPSPSRSQWPQVKLWY